MWTRQKLYRAKCRQYARYNFVCVHQTLRVTPAMEAGIVSRVWTLADLLA